MSEGEYFYTIKFFLRKSEKKTSKIFSILIWKKGYI